MYSNFQAFYSDYEKRVNWSELCPRLFSISFFCSFRPSAPFICPLSSYPCSLKSRLDPFPYKELGERKMWLPIAEVWFTRWGWCKHLWKDMTETLLNKKNWDECLRKRAVGLAICWCFCLLMFLLQIRTCLWNRDIFRPLFVKHAAQSSLSFDLIMPVTWPTPQEQETSRKGERITEARGWFVNWLHAFRRFNDKPPPHETHRWHKHQFASTDF